VRPSLVQSTQQGIIRLVRPAESAESIRGTTWADCGRRCTGGKIVQFLRTSIWGHRQRCFEWSVSQEFILCQVFWRNISQHFHGRQVSAVSNQGFGVSEFRLLTVLLFRVKIGPAGRGGLIADP